MDKGKVFEKLIHLAQKKDMKVLFAPFGQVYGRIKGNRIGVANDITIDEINYTLAHELAHSYLHFDKGNILDCTSEEYEEQADRAAVMLLDLILLEETSEMQKGGATA